MRVRVLGCGGSAAVPQIGGPDGRGDWGACDPTQPLNRRTRSAIVLEGEGGRLLVDTGPDLRAQLLANAIPRIDAILYTHAHADHLLGLDEVRILNRIMDAPMPAAMFAHTLEEISRRFDYAMKPWTGSGFFRPVLTPQTLRPGDHVTLAGHHLQVFEQDHGFSTTLGFRCGEFAYSTDAVKLDTAAMDILAGVDTWMVGCFQRAAHHTHANIAQVLDWVRLLRPRRTILTHMGFDLDYNRMKQTLPAGIEPAYDGMIIAFD